MIRKIFLSLFLGVIIAYPLYAEFTAAQISEFKGLVDVLEPDALGDAYSPDCLNIWTRHV